MSLLLVHVHASLRVSAGLQLPMVAMLMCCAAEPVPSRMHLTAKAIVAGDISAVQIIINCIYNLRFCTDVINSAL